MRVLLNQIQFVLHVLLSHWFYFHCSLILFTSRCAVAMWYGAGLATVRSWVQILPLTAVYQRQLSVPSIRGRLMSTSESWGVNGHTTRCTSPVSVVLQLRLVSGWGLRKRRQRIYRRRLRRLYILWRRSAPPYGPLRLGKGLCFTLLHFCFSGQLPITAGRLGLSHWSTEYNFSFYYD